MSAFAYQAMDAAGRPRKGVLEGDTARQIRQQLREQGLVPLEVEEVAQRESRARRSFSVGRGISATDLALITRQLATLVGSGLPLEESLATTARQSEKQRISGMLMAVRTRVMEGHSLANGLSEFPHIFPDIYRTTVAAGEQSGHLEVVLERLADYTENRQQMRQKVQLALFYPLLLTLIAVGVTVALLAYVVPEIVQVFDNIGQELPMLTVGLIAVSDFLRASWMYLVGGIVLAVLAARHIFAKPGPKRWLHGALLQMPLIGRLVRGLNTSRFARTLSILSASGVPVLEALKVSGEVVGNLPMRAAIHDAALRVREGASLAGALERSGYFPPMTVHLIGSGEASGRLEQMLERAALNQERELETRIAMLMGLFEPMLILSMGVMVLIIVLAILLPIFELNQLVQ